MAITYRRAASLVVLLLCAPIAVDAETTDCPDRTDADGICEEVPVELSRIVVTATRRESPVERVPGGISVLSGDRLQQMGAHSFADYARSVPGLTFTDGGGFGGEKYVIRGITTDVFSENRATTAVYLDETPVTDAGYSGMTYPPDPLLVDIARVEVLRGPQGTLFGSGSMGGAIRIISREPDPFVTEGFAEAILSTTRHGGLGYDLRAMFNAPLADHEAAVRGVAYFRALDGWIENTALNQPDVNTNETKGLRLAGSWLGHDRLKITGRIVYQNRKSDGTAIDQGDPEWTQQRASEEPNQDRWTLANLDIQYGFDGADFISTTSWRERDIDTRADVTEFFGYSTITAVNQDGLDEFVQEFRLASTGEGRFQWLAGLFYQDQDYFFGQDFPAPGFDEATGGLASMFGHPDNLYVGRTDRSMEQRAAFGDVTWRLSDRWEGELGGRWFRFDHAQQVVADGYFNGGYSEEFTEVDEDGFIPRVNLAYAHSESLNFYGLVSGGYRPGGTNEAVAESYPPCREDLEHLGLNGIPRLYESDSLWNYEMGLKSSWSDHRVYLNVAFYHIDWSDIQTGQFIDCGAYFYVNAGEAASKGAEVELAAYPVRNLELTLNASYTDATLSEDSENLGAPKGSELPGVPDWTVGGALTWYFSAFADASTWFRLDYQYVGSSWNLVSPDFRQKIPSYSLAHLRLGYSRGPWEAALFADNLLDERAIITVHDNFAGRYVTTARPRTFGASVRFSY